jgi:RNA polymerase sigma-70 factor (ECF subfamily)
MSQSGDQESRSFERLLNRHKSAIYRQMVRMCGNAEDAEDVLSESMLNAYRSMQKLKDPEAFRAWMAMIARRTCVRVKRRTELHPVLRLADLEILGEEPASGSPSPDELLQIEQTKHCIHSVIDSLPDHYRSVYLLREVEGASAEETAQKLGITVAAVKARLHRAREIVRTGLDALLQQ